MPRRGQLFALGSPRISLERYVALELREATWLLPRKRDRPQSTQSPDLVCSLSARELEEDELG